ncbi:MAG TPA: AMP-binding protein [Steroidobacteraceae bacterium]|nr:AMP-binding protein [Steroidobacteraceae bacterium]
MRSDKGASAFVAARDLLLRLRDDPDRAAAEFRWPPLHEFNWATDYFDPLAASIERDAVRVVGDDGEQQVLTYRGLSRRSSQLANYLRACGIRAGDRVLLMLGNDIALWECILALMKLRAVMIPATTLMQREDLRDRLERGSVSAIIAESDCASRFEDLPGAAIRIAVGPAASGWLDFAQSRNASMEWVRLPCRADDLLLLYFTSGTTARPKLVAHTHSSYPVGHLSTLYWIGLRPGDVHLNLSSPGWAKHAWSCVFAPFNAEATVLAYRYERFDARRLLEVLTAQRVTTFCAPPTVWRMLIQHDMSGHRGVLRELVSAGEPLNPQVIDHVRRIWKLTIRDGYGQTETTAMAGNSPGSRIKDGSMGRALPGYRIELLDAEGNPAQEGEICIPLAGRATGLMQGYLDSGETPARPTDAEYYRTGDVAVRDEEGYLTYVGRMDDVFKSSDYRISPFELESVLIEHEAVAEAAVVPSPDPMRLAIPKAYIVLTAGHAQNAETALSIFRHVHARVAPYKRIRRIEFAPLPKTISGKIRRVDLRAAEHPRSGQEHHPGEFWEEDFPALRSPQP